MSDTKIITNNTLGFDLPVEVPATVEAYDALFGAGAALNNAITYGMFHIWNGGFRSAYAERLSEVTGLKCPTKDGSEDGEPISEAKYLAWLYAQRDEEGNPVLTEARAFEIAKEVAAEVGGLQPRQARGTGQRSKETQKLGNELFNQVQSGARTLEDFVAKFEAANPGKVFASLGDPSTPTPFIEAVHINTLRLTAEAKRAAAAM